jgi:hypothetical protein
MTNFSYKSIAIAMVLNSLGICNLIASTWTQLNSSTLIVQQSSLTKDTIHRVGDLFGGGVIFFVDRTGHHGLICSLSDIVDPKSFQQFSKQDPTKLKGRKDSADLINQVFAVHKVEHAEELCNKYNNSNYGTGVFSDWHLPTLEQLEILFLVKNEVNKALEDFNKAITDPLNGRRAGALFFARHLDYFIVTQNSHPSPGLGTVKTIYRDPKLIVHLPGLAKNEAPRRGRHLISLFSLTNDIDLET